VAAPGLPISAAITLADKQIQAVACAIENKAMIITGGVNVYPREVEDVLLKHPAVQDAAVFGIPDEEFGEAVHAAVELVEGHRVTAEVLISHCRSQLAHLKCPKKIDFHASLPRHQTGKLYKGLLKSAFLAAAERSRD